MKQCPTCHGAGSVPNDLVVPKAVVFDREQERKHLSYMPMNSTEGSTAVEDAVLDVMAAASAGVSREGLVRMLRSRVADVKDKYPEVRELPARQAIAVSLDRYIHGLSYLSF